MNMIGFPVSLVVKPLIGPFADQHTDNDDY
jgi:hypothetical protein